ncbi:MAG: hypothetical protein ABIS92_08005 [Polyangia bacterium]
MAATEPSDSPPPPRPASAASLPTKEATEARARPLPGQLSAKFAIDPRNPEGNIPSIKDRNSNPLEFGYFLQDLLERAEQARKENDFEGVIRYYRAVAKAVPDNAKGWSKLCEAYDFVKDRDRAIRACKYAIDRPAVELQDYLRYVRLILSREDQLPASDQGEVNAVLAHLDEQPSLELVSNELRCEAGVKLKDVAMLERCTKVLVRLAPGDPKTVVFQWSLAMQKGQRSEAERFIALARKSGVVLANVERMEKVTSSSLDGDARHRMVLGAIVLLLGSLTLVAVARRRASQRLAR